MSSERRDEVNDRLPTARLGEGAVVWFTGLSGSGKTTVAQAVAERLRAAGRACTVLDGDVLRDGLNADLSFSPEDRAENIRRVGEVAALFAREGLIALCAFISPYAEGRALARRAAEERGQARFIEVFVDTPLSVCEDRDVKGLYAKARRGEVPMFTGISAPYEAPETPELRLAAGEQPLDACVARVLALLA